MATLPGLMARLTFFMSMVRALCNSPIPSPARWLHSMAVASLDSSPAMAWSPISGNTSATAWAAPLEVGETYLLEFSLSNGTANWYGKRGSDGIGAAFTLAQPVQLIHDVLPITPQIEITSIVYHTDWRTYTFSYTATQAFSVHHHRQFSH